MIYKDTWLTIGYIEDIYIYIYMNNTVYNKGIWFTT